MAKDSKNRRNQPPPLTVALAVLALQKSDDGLCHCEIHDSLASPTFTGKTLWDFSCLCHGTPPPSDRSSSSITDANSLLNQSHCLGPHIGSRGTSYQVPLSQRFLCTRV